MTYDEQGDVWDDYEIALSRSCHLSTWDYFVETGEIPLSAAGSGDWCLHHKDPTQRHLDHSRYCKWLVEDVEPVTLPMHMKIHKDWERREQEHGFLSKLFLDKAKAMGWDIA